MAERSRARQQQVEITIRKASRADIEEIRGLIARSVRGLGARYYTPRQIDLSIEKVFGVDTQLIDDGTYYVAQIADQGDKILGVGGWSKRATMYGGDQFKLDDDVEIDPASSPARIRAFFVDPEHARKGIGRRILTHCETAAIAFGFSTAELVATLPGEPLYAALGYDVVEPIEADLGDGETLPCKRMRKNLIAGE